MYKEGFNGFLKEVLSLIRFLQLQISQKSLTADSVGSEFRTPREQAKFKEISERAKLREINGTSEIIYFNKIIYEYIK